MVVAFIGYVASLGIRIAPPASRATLSMDVSDISNLEVESNVLLRGVQVGKVSRIDTTTSHATIHFYIEDKYKIPADSVVRLENLSALGESYIELEPRHSGGPVFQDGQRVAPQSIKPPGSISELGVSVVHMLNQLDPNQLKRVIGEADTGLPDPYSVLPNLKRASLLLRNTTADLNGRGKKVLENSQSLLENAGFVGPALAETIPAVQALGPELHEEWANAMTVPTRLPAPGSVYLLGKFIQRIQRLLDDRAPDIRVLTEPLTANVKAIAASLTTIDTSQVLANLLSAVPEDGAINLHVTIPERQAGN
ncbi:MCE family protein [Mycobacterium timonense]|uniref:MCE family protein n=2 Tax=Mycobacteriaceae TaxID=1762 RepID=A0AAW5SAB6_MYCBC|nr:mammalian cell entry protein [Mycobacterium nebraskense]MCA2296392.1 MCE family protein [Mycobacterium avium]MCV6991920.1 MCE family protein [Mycobacterium bouchedurhonense]MCV6997369.1 MCE family protein [Mycobacterium timonense]ORA42208.1 MCE family protein [Mycobacterium bouchedurhonense]